MGEVKQKAKKVRWNVSKSMSCVCETIANSKLKVKEFKEYSQAMERLMGLYSLSKTQVWILCLVCDFYLGTNNSMDMGDIADRLSVSAMSIMRWKKDVEKLIEIEILEWDCYHEDFKPSEDFCNSLYENIVFVPGEKQGVDDVGFISHVADRYENRRREGKTSFAMHAELVRCEEKYCYLPVVKRVREEIKSFTYRFFLYDLASDVMDGRYSILNLTVSDLWDGNLRYKVSKEMMEETHELFQKNLVEFVDKGNFSDATITLTEKGRTLLFGENANLFEEKVNEKNLIKPETIKTKRLFYSTENQKEIDNLKNALQEDTLKNIQKRLSNDGLPVGVAILLYGAPGTGKTESVLQIAKETGRSIVHVDISESKSAWFGESEKIMKKIFSGYKKTCETFEKRGEKIPILLFNEADALISKRQNLTSGNIQQTENSIQNIILEELEGLKGIFVATTNFANNMDSAFERRFLFKIKFENPSREAKTSIWMNKLSWINEKSAEEFASAYDFSGGQIDNIVRKIAMNEIISGERPCISDIHKMCRSEKIETTGDAKKIGFAI